MLVHVAELSFTVCFVLSQQDSQQAAVWQGKCWRMKNQGQPKQYIRNVKCLMFADRNTSLIQLVKMSLIFIYHCGLEKVVEWANKTTFGLLPAQAEGDVSNHTAQNRALGTVCTGAVDRASWLNGLILFDLRLYYLM